MLEWFSQWNPMLTTILAFATLVFLVLNYILVLKVRREDQSKELEQKMTELVDNLSKEIVSLGREVSEIQGFLQMRGKQDP